MYLKDIGGEELLSQFHVVTMVSNSARYLSRYRIYRQWMEMMKATGVNVITVEVAFGDRPFEVTERDNPNHVQLRTIDELWIKENAINIGINYACQVWPDAKYFAWIDADVFPMRTPRDWLLETLQQLQHYHVVQMFEHAVDLDPQYNIMSKPHQGFLAAYIKSGFKLPSGHGNWKYYGAGHPGFCFAATRQGLDYLGGLIDFAILGAGDRHMAMGLIGQIEASIPGGLHPQYKDELMQWQSRASKHIRRDIGYVSGGIYHYFHGKKVNRQYADRWKILVDCQFNPNTDIKRDTQGLWQIEDNDDRQIMLRDKVRRYFTARNEDDISF
jgi:hypothetical protein